MYYDATKHFASHGVKVDNVSVDLEAMMAQKDKSVAGLTGGIEGLFKKNKVTYVKGWGSLAGPNEVKVNLLEGGEASVKTKNIMIATGSDVSSVPGLTIDEDKCATCSHPRAFETCFHSLAAHCQPHPRKAVPLEHRWHHA